MSKNNQLNIIGFIAFILTILSYASCFVIYEGRQAIITQFGKPVRTVTQAGLHWKAPFIQDVRMIDLRVLNWDGFPNQIPTKDKKYIKVDTTARWKIIDPLKFIQTVQNEHGARTRLDAILDGVTRDVISSQNLVETVRNSNSILESLNEKKKKKLEKNDEALEDLQIEEEITGEIEKIATGREKLSQTIAEIAAKELESLGIQLIDVQFKRIAYEKSVQEKVYTRMISERERIAEKIRSYGKGEKAKIEGKTEKDLRQIRSEAYRRVQAIKGKAEAQATKIYASSLKRDPRFYEFLRKLEAYDNSINPEIKFLTSSDNKFWNVLMNGISK